MFYNACFSVALITVHFQAGFAQSVARLSGVLKRVQAYFPLKSLWDTRRAIKKVVRIVYHFAQLYIQTW